MKNFLTFGLLLVLNFSFGQENPYDSWNKNYLEVDYEEIVNDEIQYADSVEKDSTAVQFFSRLKKYRFEAQYTGNWREIDQRRIEVMKMVFKMRAGNVPEIFDSIEKEAEMKMENGTIWMPIQPNLEKPFKKEIKKNRHVYIYALFFNMHNMSGELYNLFLISEFIAE